MTLNFSNNAPLVAGCSAHTVLRLLHELGPSAQMDIARELKISKAASNQHFLRLFEERYIMEGTMQLNPRGRPSQVWQINAAGNFFLGISVEDGALGAVLTDFNGVVLERAGRRLHDCGDQAAFLKLLYELVEIMLAKVAERNGRLLQCFVAAPGMIDPEGLIVNSPNLHALDGLNLDQLLNSRYHIPVFCDACSHAYVAAECRDVPPDSTIMVLIWSNGIGVSLLCNGIPIQWPAINVRRFRGLWDFGHIRVVKDGRLCHCGKRGCLEAYYGGAALAELYPGLNAASAEELTGAVLNGTPGAREAVSHAAAALAEHLHWTIELFGVDTIIISGALSPAFEFYQQAFSDSLNVFYTAEEYASIAIRKGDFSPENTQLGAALVARNFFLSPHHLRSSRGIWSKQ